MDALTFGHVLISLIGIGTGLVVAFGMTAGKRMDRMTSWFLWTTVATSVSGFLFPFNGITPAIVVGALSLVVLAATIYARYSRGMAAGWRRTYVIGALVTLYLNVFVLVVQSFLKIPALHALAPNGNEPAFGIAQGVVLAAFVVLGVKAVKGFREAPVVRARAAGAR